MCVYIYTHIYIQTNKWNKIHAFVCGAGGGGGGSQKKWTECS